MLIQVLALLRLLRGRASLVVIEILYSELLRTSRQLFEALIRFWSPTAEFIMLFTFDWTVRAVSEVTESDE